MPVTDAVPATQTASTLLQQAQDALAAAVQGEREAKRDYDNAGAQDRELLTAAWQEARKARERAQTLVDQRECARISLIAAIPAARVDARREAAPAREELDRLVQDLIDIGGPGAGPREET